MTRKEKWITGGVLAVNLGLGVALMARADLHQLSGNAGADAGAEPVATLDEAPPLRESEFPTPKD